jgi:hypothetical protein
MEMYRILFILIIQYRHNIPRQQDILDSWFFIIKTREFLLVLNNNGGRRSIWNDLDERSTSIHGKRLSQGIFSFRRAQNWKTNTPTSK